MKKLIKCLASFFYLGYFPVCPGTVASLAGLGLYFLFGASRLYYALAVLIISIVGFLVCGRAERIYQEKDSSKIVVDEVAGVLLTFWGIRACWPLLIIGFVIYRAFDICKVPPAGRIEKIPGSLGIMGDDLLAGFYTNIILQITMRLI
ncbi:phosphatidylglycerophosphatase A [Candidatus Omnitrophota bacterium]